MSAILKVNNITTTTGNPLINDIGGNHVVNFRQIYFSDYENFVSNPTGNGTPVTPLTLSIKPLSADNILIMEWMVSGEADNDVHFVMHRNGSIITTAGEEGYNNQAGNVRFSGLHVSWYDQNTDSTPSNHRFSYQCVAGTTNELFFTPAVRSTDATVNAFRINRFYTTADEQNSSFGFLWEFTPG
jgi:hypothetical protein